MVRPRSRRQDGFTLFELIIVVLIISVTAALAVPSINTAMADARLQRSSLDVIRLLRAARTDAMAYGRAMVVDFNQRGSTGGIRSHLRLFRGRTSACNSNDWATIIVAGCDGAAGCVDQVDLTNYAGGGWDSGAVSTGGAIARWCFQSNGAIGVQPGATGRFRFSAPAGQGGWQFTFRRFNGGTPEGVARVVVLAQGGEASLQR